MNHMDNQNESQVESGFCSSGPGLGFPVPKCWDTTVDSWRPLKIKPCMHL